MRHVFSYYVTFMQLDNGIYKTGGSNFGFMGSVLGLTEINFGELIKGIYITLTDATLEIRYGEKPYEDGKYIISSDIIKKEVCDVLWDGIKLSYRNVEEKALKEIKRQYMEKFDKDIIILGWSETSLY